METEHKPLIDHYSTCHKFKVGHSRLDFAHNGLTKELAHSEMWDGCAFMIPVHYGPPPLEVQTWLNGSTASVNCGRLVY